MAVARFGPYKVSGVDGRNALPGTPVHVLDTTGASVHIDSDDAGSTEITGQQEAYVADASGVTSGSESTTTTHGIVLVDEDSNINFVVEEGDYELVVPGDENPILITVGNVQAPAFSETVNVKAGAVSAANNINPPGTRLPVSGKATFVARVGTAPVGSSLIVRLNKNGTVVGSIAIVTGASSQAGAAYALTAISAAVSGTDIFTLTLGAGHGVVAGDVVELKGFTPANYNGTWKVASVTSTTIVLTATGMVAGTPVNATVQGTGTFGIPTPLPVAAGDVITYDVTAVGSGTAGSDLAIDVSVA